MALIAYCRDTLGDGAVAGDKRWSGSFGVNVDYVARSNGSIEIIPLAGLQVCVCVRARVRECECAFACSASP